jgi:hypothetical protein
VTDDEILDVVAEWRIDGRQGLSFQMADWIEAEVARREAEAEQRKRDRKDAERGRWLQKWFRAESPKMDGTYAYQLRLGWQRLAGRTIEEAIDAAMEAERKERGE